ncbi:MAG: cell wall anchor [Patescibacteria group bacterium]|nr:MAG: cell wall anchor [Patescibacteria group bacterium]
MKRKYMIFSLIASAFLFYPTNAQASSDARVRVLHASPDAPAVDVLVNDKVEIEDLSFGNITGYLSLPAGAYSVKVRPANSGGPDVISTSLNLRPGRDYTVAASNKLESIKANVYVDKNFLANDHKAKLRVLHLSPGAPAVDIALKNGKVLLKNLSYENASRYLRLNPGKYDLEVRVAGTQTVVQDLPGVEISANKVYQVYAVGVVGGNPNFGIRLSSDNATSLRDRFSHRLQD